MANVGIDRLLGSLARSNNRDLQYAELEQQAQQADQNRGLALTQQANHLAAAQGAQEYARAQDALDRARQGRMDAAGLEQARAHENRMLQQHLAEQAIRQKQLELMGAKNQTTRDVGMANAKARATPRPSGRAGQSPASQSKAMKLKEMGVLSNTLRNLAPNAVMGGDWAQQYNETYNQLQTAHQQLNAMEKSEGAPLTPPPAVAPPPPPAGIAKPPNPAAGGYYLDIINGGG